MKVVTPINSRAQKIIEDEVSRHPLTLEQRIHQHFAQAFTIWLITSMEDSETILTPWLQSQPQATRHVFELAKLCASSQPYIEAEMSRTLGAVVLNLESAEEELSDQEDSLDTDEDELSLMDDGVVARKLLRANVKSKIFDRMGDAIHVLDARCAMADRNHGGPINSEMPRFDALLDGTLKCAMKIGKSMEFSASYTGIDLRLIMLREAEAKLFDLLRAAMEESYSELDAVGVPPYTAKAAKVALSNRPAMPQGFNRPQLVLPVGATSPATDEGSAYQESQSPGPANGIPFQGYFPGNVAPFQPGITYTPVGTTSEAAVPLASFTSGYSGPQVIVIDGASGGVRKGDVSDIPRALKRDHQNPEPQPDSGSSRTESAATKPEDRPKESDDPYVGYFDDAQEPGESDCDAAHKTLKAHLPPHASSLNSEIILNAARQRLKIADAITRNYVDDQTITEDARLMIEAMSSDIRRIATVDAQFLVNPAHVCRVALEVIAMSFRLPSVMNVYSGGFMTLFNALKDYDLRKVKASCRMIEPQRQKIIRHVLKTSAANRLNITTALSDEIAKRYFQSVEDGWRDIINRCLVPCISHFIIEHGEHSEETRSVIQLAFAATKMDPAEAGSSNEISDQFSDIVELCGFSEPKKHQLLCYWKGSQQVIAREGADLMSIFFSVAKPCRWMAHGVNHLSCITAFHSVNGIIELHQALASSEKERLGITDFLRRFADGEITPVDMGMEIHNLRATTRAALAAHQDGD